MLFKEFIDRKSDVVRLEDAVMSMVNKQLSSFTGEC